MVAQKRTMCPQGMEGDRDGDGRGGKGRVEEGGMGVGGRDGDCSV